MYAKYLSWLTVSATQSATSARRGHVSCNYMTTLKLIVTLTIFILFFGCDKKVQRRQNEINRIVFATGGCPGTCPVQAIDIDSKLTVKYHGIQYTDTIGFYVGQYTNDLWDTLNLKFESINYRHLDSMYQHSADDQSTEIYIYYNDNQVKHVYGQELSLPDSVMTVYKWLMTSIKQTKLTQTKDSLIFPTRIQKPVTPLPIKI